MHIILSNSRLPTLCTTWGMPLIFATPQSPKQKAGTLGIGVVFEVVAEEFD